jgi:WD40 repeat protein
LVISADGKELASAGNDGTVVWSAATGVKLQSVTDTGNPQQAVAFAPDGKVLATASSDRRIRLWSLESGKQLTPIAVHSNQITSIAFSPDGKRLLSGAYDCSMRLWDTKSGEQLHAWEYRHGNATSVQVAFSADGQTIAATCLDGAWSVRLWDVSTGQAGKLLSKEFWEGLACSPDGKLLAAGCWSEKSSALSRSFDVLIWELASGRVAHSIQGIRGDLNAIAFRSDGKLLATGEVVRTRGRGGFGLVRLWDVPTCKPAGRLYTKQGHDGDGDMPAMAFSPDGNLLAVGKMSGRIQVWDVASGAIRCSFGKRDQNTMAVLFTKDSKLLISGGIGQGVQLWDVTSGQEVCKAESPRGGDVTSLALTRDGKLLASGGMDGNVIVWDLFRLQGLAKE